MADSTGRISSADLVPVWTECAQKKLGSLSQDDLATIDLGVEVYLEAKRLGSKARVNYADFMSFMLDGTEAYADDGTVVSVLRQAAAKNPQLFHETVLQFVNCRLQQASPENQSPDTALFGKVLPQNPASEATGLVQPPSSQGDVDMVASTDEDPDRVQVSLPEFIQCLQDLMPNRLDQHSDPCSVQPTGGPHELANNLFRVLGVSEDGRLDLYNALAYILDRRKTAVELILYDISYGASRMFSQAILGQQFEAIYHSSVLVFGTEFWYGGQVFENEPPIDAQTFGPPLSDVSFEQLIPSVYNPTIKTVRLGSTLATFFELREFLQTQMKPKYRADNYDVLSHNCNCFSDDIARFLTGKGIPEAVRQLPQLVMNTAGAKLLRPVLNRWLRSFEGTEDGKGYANADMLNTDGIDEECELWEEAVLVAAKEAAVDGSIDLGYFDPTESHSYRRKEVKRGSVMREESGRLVRPKSREEISFRSSKSEERKEIKRSAIRRLVDGRFVHARLV